MSSLVKPRSNSSRVLFYAGCEDVFNHQQPYFLESCFLCQKQLGANNDIFMYRGNTPFCSDECRQEQIEIDEAKERPWRLRGLRNKVAENNTKKIGTTTTTTTKRSVQTGTVAVA